MRGTIRVCSYCGMPYGCKVEMLDGRIDILREEMDHFFPKAKSGQEGDLISVCHHCNARKGTRVFDTLEEAKAYLGKKMFSSIRDWKHPLMDFTDIPSKPFKEPKCEKINKINRVPELPSRETHDDKVGKVLQRRVSSSVAPESKTPCLKPGLGHCWEGIRGFAYWQCECGAEMIGVYPC